MNITHITSAGVSRAQRPWQCGLAWLTLALAALTAALAPAVQASFESDLGGLAKHSIKQRTVAVEAIAASTDARATALLRGLLDGRVYRVKKGNVIAFGEDVDAGIALTGVLHGAALGTHGKRAVRKVTINNRLRTLIRSALARRSLADPDPAVRVAAIEAMLKDLDDEAETLLRELEARETDVQVREAIAVALAVTDVRGGDAAARLRAVRVLGDSDVALARNVLTALVGEARADPAVLTAARRALDDIASRARLYAGLETLFFGLSLGSVLALAAVGLAITFGVIGVINMAHGELMMLGAYTTYVIQQWLPGAAGWSLLLAVPAAFCVAAVFGIAIERGVIRLLYGRPLETLLATFGISLLLQQLVRSTFGPLNRSVVTPDWLSGSYAFNAAFSITYNRLAIIIFTLAVFAVLAYVMKRTALGLQVRAVAQNRPMASALGVRSAHVDALTFALGSGIAGVAGVALSQLTNVGPNLGQGYIVDSFMVVVFGGVGNLWGTLVSGFTLGVANKVMEPWTGAVLAKVVVLVFIIIFIQRRPRGLFPPRGRAAES